MEMFRFNWNIISIFHFLVKPNKTDPWFRKDATLSWAKLKQTNLSLTRFLFKSLFSDQVLFLTTIFHQQERNICDFENVPTTAVFNKKNASSESIFSWHFSWIDGHLFSLGIVQLKTHLFPQHSYGALCTHWMPKIISRSAISHKSLEHGTWNKKKKSGIQ